jgi:hypothetical protein
VREGLEREEMTGWDSRAQRWMGPCTQAQAEHVAQSLQRLAPIGKAKGTREHERDLLRCLRPIGESRSRKGSRSTYMEVLSSPLQRSGAMCYVVYNTASYKGGERARPRKRTGAGEAERQSAGPRCWRRANRSLPASNESNFF